MMRALCTLLALFVWGGSAAIGAPPAPPVPVASAPTPTQPANVDAPAPTAQRQAFALGFALARPGAESRAFLARVKALRFAEPGEDTALSTALLARDAKDLRGVERRSYAEAARTLRALSAPPELLQWADGTARLLTEPQIVSDEAKTYSKSDPATASILSTIDEAEAVKIIANRNTQALQTWLKLTQGGAGVWAMSVGTLASGMHGAASSGQPFLLPRALVQTLRSSAPPGTPLAVLRLLSALAPRGKGNLGYLVRPSDVSVAAADIAPAALSLLDSYGAQPLAAEITPAPKP